MQHRRGEDVTPAPHAPFPAAAAGAPAPLGEGDVGQRGGLAGEGDGGRPSDEDLWRWLGQAALRLLERHEAVGRARRKGLDFWLAQRGRGAAADQVRRVAALLRARGLLRWKDPRGGSR
jgi:hypothetical protein